MKHLPLSMSETLAKVYPPFELMDEQAITSQDLAQLNFRITVINQLLIACVEMIEKNANFWAEIDLHDFKKYLDQNKVVIFDTQQYFQDGSRTMAMLDNMKSNIQKIERAMANATAFNFDLERMKERVKGEFITLPNSYQTPEELREWLLKQA